MKQLEKNIKAKESEIKALTLARPPAVPVTPKVQQSVPTTPKAPPAVPSTPKAPPASLPQTLRRTPALPQTPRTPLLGIILF